MKNWLGEFLNKIRYNKAARADVYIADKDKPKKANCCGGTGKNCHCSPKKPTATKPAPKKKPSGGGFKKETPIE